MQDLILPPGFLRGTRVWLQLIRNCKTFSLYKPKFGNAEHSTIWHSVAKDKPSYSSSKVRSSSSSYSMPQSTQSFKCSVAEMSQYWTCQFMLSLGGNSPLQDHQDAQAHRRFRQPEQASSAESP